MAPPERALEILQEAIEEQNAAITCGGSIPISTHHDHSAGPDTKPIASPPVIIRWSSNGADIFEGGRAIQFPVTAATGEESHQNAQIEKLIRDCEPATFGVGDKEVLDESYRKAAKMDDTRFCTNFQPHNYGVIDAIARALLPAIDLTDSEEDISTELLGVVAKLYKLNIYSGESGKFKAHVDTPRGATQFGSLVVCLPYPHKGGQLAVRHRGLETIYDWSNTESNEITWAAFYSDCEHEVLEVKSGHRVTLTYNLYTSHSISNPISRFPITDPTKYPIYGTAKALVLDSEFMEEGGTLGIYCNHKYAHTASDASRRLPSTLKGTDLIFYSTFRALGLRVRVRPIMNIPQEQLSSDDEEGDFIGKDHHEVALSDVCVEDNSSYPIPVAIREEWPCTFMKDIYWLNQPLSEEMAWVRQTYGNQPEIECLYSSAAILVTIPDFETRIDSLSQSKRKRTESEA